MYHQNYWGGASASLVPRKVRPRFFIVKNIVELEAMALTLATLMSVFQGSCVGPLLLFIYIHDFPQIVKASTVSIYAGDANLTFQSQAISRLSETIHDILKSLGLWMQGNKLSLNVLKAQSMLICTEPKHQKLGNAGVISA